MRPLVVPWLVARAGFHRRQDVNEAGVVTAPSEDLLDARLFAQAALAHELDLDAGLLGELLGVAPHLLAQRLGKTRVVEDADAVRVQVRGHAGGVGQPR